MKKTYLETVDSTNEYIKRNADTFCDGDYVYTFSQSAGKGRRGRQWESNKKGLALSIFVNDKRNAQTVPLASAEAVRCVLEKHMKIPLKIKWPNDILANNKKLCGILCEGTKDGYIIGIGINISQEKADFVEVNLPYATSILMETEKIIDREKLTRKIAKEVVKNLNMKESKLIDKFTENCITIGQKIKVISVNEEYEAFAVGIDKNGGLKIQTETDIKTVISGEVSVRGIYGYGE